MIRVIAFIIALIIALAVAYYLIDLEPKQQQVQQKPEQVVVEKPIYITEEVDQTQVYRMLVDLNVGDIIDAQHYEEIGYATHLMHPEFIVADPNDPSTRIDGMIVRSPLLNGEIVVRSKLQNPNDPSYITSTLGEGMRAVTINVDTTSAVAGFIQPGDHVDMLLTFEVSAETPEGDETMEEAEIPLPASGGSSFRFTETILDNIKIIAIDQQATSSQGGGYIPSTVTVELSPTDAQKVRLAETFGTISLVLRGLAKKDEETGEEETAEETTRPVSLSDLTRLFPPSYFPVLFDNTTDYNISVVDIFEEATPAADGSFTPIDVNGNPIILDENGRPLEDEPQIIAYDADGNPIYFTGIVNGQPTFVDKDGNVIPGTITKTVTEIDPITGESITKTVEIRNPVLANAIKSSGSLAQSGTTTPSWFEKKKRAEEEKKKEEEEAEKAEKGPEFLTINVFRGKSREEVKFEIKEEEAEE